MATPYVHVLKAVALATAISDVPTLESGLFGVFFSKQKLIKN